MRNLGELRSRAPHGVLLALLVGLMARLARWLCCVRVVEIDGAWYARLAERLSDGAYEGLVPGPEVMFPPLYPAGIAALAATGLDPVTAGRLLSLAGGLAVIVLGWRLARRLGGDRAATATAWFLALAPAQIASSVAVFPEAVHSAFLLGAVVLMSRPARVRRAAAAGALLALAYLVRVESLAIIAWTIGVLFILGWRDDAGRRRRGLVLVVVLVCFVGTLPFAFHLERVTGTWRWEGKGGRISRAIDRMQGGATFRDAHFEVDAEGRERGAFLSLEPTTGPGWRVLDFRRSGWWTHAGHGMKRLSSMALTGHTWMSLFLAITLLFAFRAGRRAGRVDLLLFGWVAAGLAAFILYRPAIRYIAPLAIPFALWSGRVLADLRGRWLGIPVAVLAALLALSTARSLVTGMSEYDESAATHASVRDVGAVLRELPGKGAVMSDDARVAYFSDRPWVPFPAAPHWEAALRWARSRGVEWIHLRRFGGQGLGPAPAELQRVSDQFESLFRLER